MGFFKQLLHTAGIFLETAVYAAGTLAAYVGDKAGKLARVAKQAYHDYKSRNIPQEKRDNRPEEDCYRGGIVSRKRGIIEMGCRKSLFRFSVLLTAIGTIKSPLTYA